MGDYMRKEKRKFKWPKYISMIFIMIIMYIFGTLLGQYIQAIKASGSGALSILFEIIILMFCIYVAIIIQIAIHEGGHLIGGLLSGYKFSSFRIFNFMWIKENGKLKLKKLSLAGTGGQCLMLPPEFKDGKIPYKLYNLGGSIMNIIASYIFLGFYLLWTNIRIVSIFLLMLSVVGIIFAIINGVPMQFGTIDNDGYNALSLGKNSSALKAFWVQMKVNGLLSKGVRLKNMPANLFLKPKDEELNNSIIASKAVFVCNYLMDKHKFDEAEKEIHRLLGMDTAMVGMHRNLMICDEIYCKAISGNSKEEIDSLLNKQQKKFMQSMKKFPSVLRTEYVYALLVEQDNNKAEEIKNKFKEISSTYPYESEIESEYELMEIANNKVEA